MRDAFIAVAARNEAIRKAQRAADARKAVRVVIYAKVRTI